MTSQRSMWVALTTAISLAGCAETAMPASEAPVDECVVGLWVRTRQACDCSFGETPECGEPTCEEFQTAWAMEPDGWMGDFTVRFTEGSSRTASVASQVLEGRWELEADGQLARIHGGLPRLGPIECSASRLTWRGIEYTRASEELSGALLPVLSDETRWTGVSY